MAGVDRAVIEKGAAMLGVELSAFIDEVIAAMRPVAAELGLAGAGAGGSPVYKSTAPNGKPPS